MYSLKCSF